MVVLIAALGMGVAYFVTKTVMGEATTEEVSVKQVESIDTSFATPNTNVFNRDAINPTVEVQINQGAQ